MLGNRYFTKINYRQNMVSVLFHKITIKKNIYHAYYSEKSCRKVGKNFFAIWIEVTSSTSKEVKIKLYI